MAHTTDTSPSAPGSASGGPPLARRLVRRAKQGLLLIVLAVVLSVAAWTFAALTFDYSTGERAGYLQKLSNRGWICKTWEGELALVNLPGATPEIFHFSARDEGAVAQLQAALGKRVVLHYEQHVGVPTSCFGETSYFVTSVTPVQDGMEPRP